MQLERDLRNSDRHNLLTVIRTTLALHLIGQVAHAYLRLVLAEMRSWAKEYSGTSKGHETDNVCTFQSLHRCMGNMCT